MFEYFFVAHLAQIIYYVECRYLYLRDIFAWMRHGHLLNILPLQPVYPIRLYKWQPCKSFWKLELYHLTVATTYAIQTQNFSVGSCRTRYFILFFLFLFHLATLSRCWWNAINHQAFYATRIWGDLDEKPRPEGRTLDVSQIDVRTGLKYEPSKSMPISYSYYLIMYLHYVTGKV